MPLSAGPSNPTAAANDASVGAVAWTNVANIEGSSAFATASPGGSAITEYAKGSAFGFAVPSNASVAGIAASLDAKATNILTAGTDNSVKLAIGGTISGTNQASGANSITSTLTTFTWGGASNLWGLTPTPSNVNASTFGVGVALKAGSGGSQFSIQNMKMTVYYNLLGGLFRQSLLAGLGAGGPFYQNPITRHRIPPLTERWEERRGLWVPVR